MTRTRAFRRRKHFLKVKKAYKVLKSWGYEQEDIGKSARYIAENMKSCSCQMCRNQRHSMFYSNWEKLTLQEKKNLLRFRQEIKDYERTKHSRTFT